MTKAHVVAAPPLVQFSVPRVRMDRAQNPLGTRQNDGLDTRIMGAYGRDMSVGLIDGVGKSD